MLFVDNWINHSHYFNPFQSEWREQEMYIFEQMNFNREQRDY